MKAKEYLYLDNTFFIWDTLLKEFATAVVVCLLGCAQESSIKIQKCIYLYYFGYWELNSTCLLLSLRVE